MKNIIFLSLAIILMIATRGHNNWIYVLVHLPDFTIPALFIAGVYFRSTWVALALIISAIAIDNYAIVYQGISANCITPAYSFLPLTYYLVFWLTKFISTLTIDKNIIKNLLLVVAIIVTQWFLATLSYYLFINSPWSELLPYMLKWSVVEIPIMLSWMVIIIITFTLVLKIIMTTKLQNSVKL